MKFEVEIFRTYTDRSGLSGKDLIAAQDHDNSHTIDEMLNSRNIPPETPSFWGRLFYIICVLDGSQKEQDIFDQRIDAQLKNDILKTNLALPLDKQHHHPH